MKKMKKLLTGIVMAAMVLAMGMPVITVKAAGGDYTLASKDNKVLTYKAGEAQKWTLLVINNTEADSGPLVVAPCLEDTGDKWPFKTEYQNYRKDIDNIPAGQSKEIVFDFTQREDAPTARYTLQFTLYKGEDEAAVQNFYVNTTAKQTETTQKEDPKKEDTKKPATDPNKGQSQGNSGGDDAAAGGYSNGDVSYSGGDGGSSGGDGDSSASIPRVIVTGFSTNPKEVKAGEDFTLTIHLRNTSKKTRVSNMLFDLSAPTEGTDEQTTAPAFLPSSGSSSIYLDGIKANGTADISIRLNAKADLVQKPYSIEMSMKYEDSSASQIDGSSSLSIPVKQDARFEFSEFELSSESIEVGSEANVMCNLYNLGRIKLYNVKAIFEGACIDKEEVFIGNIDSGSSTSIDAMLEGTQETNGPVKVTMTLTYEDEAGKESKVQEEFQLEVMPEMEDEGMEMMMEEEPSRMSRILPIAIIIIIAIIAAVVFAILRKRKKNKMQNEEEELLDELDGPSEDE